MIYKIANEEELNLIWDNDIKENPNDERYIKWKGEFIKSNLEGNCTTFVAINDNVPVGQITLLNTPATHTFSNITECDQNNAYIIAARITKEFEGQGHVSKLFELLEKTALEKGVTTLTIGVETCEERTVSIYNHLGYDKCVGYDKTRNILYYTKTLIDTSKPIAKPFFETKQLIIKPFTQKLAPLLAETLNDFELIKGTTIPFPYKEEYAVDFIKKSRQKIKEGTVYGLSVIEKSTKELVGSISLSIGDVKSKRAEIGYWIRKDKHGLGYCSEAANAIIRYGFNELGLHRIIGRCLGWNKASEKVMIKCGFQYEGTEKSHVLQYGVYEDVLHYALLKKNYKG